MVVDAGLADPTPKARLPDLGSVPLPGQPATFGKLIADDNRKMGKVIRFAGIKSVGVTEAGPMARQSASFDELAPRIGRREPLASRQRGDIRRVGIWRVG